IVMLQRQAELEAARLAKEKEEEEVRQQALLAKKEKDIQKKAIKKERQKLRNSCKVCQTDEHTFDNKMTLKVENHRAPARQGASTSKML
uniref:Uncharacterized protein n=1 Tax=Equus asinus asinus TaxID=83772 RepID=A0A8C4MNX3_EQUAS